MSHAQRHDLPEGAAGHDTRYRPELGRPAMSLDGKVASVTGTAKGIRKGCAQVLSKHGARFAVVDVVAVVGPSRATARAGGLYRQEMPRTALTENKRRVGLRANGYDSCESQLSRDEQTDSY